MVILTQTDTTVGFLSQDEQQLKELKARPSSKPFIKVYQNFKLLPLRIPKSKRSLIRRSKKTTFIVKNNAFRVASHKLSATLLQKTPWFFSTSANEPSKSYERVFCEKKADIIIEDKNSLTEMPSSKLYKINAKKTRRIR